MRVDLVVRIVENVVTVVMSWAGWKEYRVKYTYPEEMSGGIQTGACTYLPLNCLLAVLPCWEESYYIRIRGVSLTDRDLAIYAWVIRERVLSTWKYRYNDRPLVMPQLVFDTEHMPGRVLREIKNKVAYNFSFGKESQLVRRLSDVVHPGGERLGCFEQESGGAVTMQEEYQKYPELKVVKTTQQALMDRVTKAYPDCVRKDNKRIEMTFMAVFLPIASFYEFPVWMCGNEYETTERYVIDAEKNYFCYPLTNPENAYYEWLQTQMLQSLFSNGVMFSPVASITAFKIAEILCYDFPDSFEDINTCWGARGVQYCGKCWKCHHAFYYYVCFGKVPPFRMAKPWISYMRPKPVYPSTGDLDEWELYGPETEAVFYKRLDCAPAWARQRLLTFLQPRGEMQYTDPRPIQTSDMSLEIGLPLIADVQGPSRP